MENFRSITFCSQTAFIIINMNPCTHAFTLGHIQTYMNINIHLFCNKHGTHVTSNHTSEEMNDKQLHLVNPD